MILIHSLKNVFHNDTKASEDTKARAKLKYIGRRLQNLRVLLRGCGFQGEILFFFKMTKDTRKSQKKEILYRQDFIIQLCEIPIDRYSFRRINIFYVQCSKQVKFTLELTDRKSKRLFFFTFQICQRSKDYLVVIVCVLGIIVCSEASQFGHEIARKKNTDSFSLKSQRLIEYLCQVENEEKAIPGEVHYGASIFDRNR